jgi:hypothetical protein
MNDVTEDVNDFAHASASVTGGVSVERTCRYPGHGPLVLQSGEWSMEGVRTMRERPLDPTSQVTGIYGNNTVYTMRIWRCEKCGYVELVDSDY